jgi:hypothetical protein
VKTIRDIAEDIQKARKILDVSDIEKEEWQESPQTKVFTLDLVGMHSEALLALAQMESGNNAERKRGEIQTLDRIISLLIEKEREDD